METKVDYITVTAPVDELDARFKIDYRRVYPGDKVKFTDESIGNPIYWEWTFDAKNPNVPPDVRGGYEIFDTEFLPAELSLIHVYDKPGLYNVLMTIRNAAGKTDEATGVVEVVNPALDPDFDYGPCGFPHTCSSPKPYCVEFFDRSRGDEITSWTWDFSNGEIKSGPDEQNTWSCFARGDHVVILRIANDLVTEADYKVVKVPVE
jgi:PKD repeat protein